MFLRVCARLDGIVTTWWNHDAGLTPVLRMSIANPVAHAATGSKIAAIKYCDLRAATRPDTMDNESPNSAAAPPAAVRWGCTTRFRAAVRHTRPATTRSKSRPGTGDHPVQQRVRAQEHGESEQQVRIRKRTQVLTPDRLGPPRQPVWKRLYRRLEIYIRPETEFEKSA